MLEPIAADTMLYEAAAEAEGIARVSPV